jgi:hypothetical protein
MNVKNIECVFDGIVSRETKVSIEIDKTESEKLRSALELIQKYEKTAIEAFKNKQKYNPVKQSDWCEISYSVKNDKLIVNIKDGMAG